MIFACGVCGAISPTRYCSEHGGSNKRPSSQARGYGAALDVARDQLLSTKPMCVKGCGTLADTVHHNPSRRRLVALGVPDVDNIRFLQPVCSACKAREAAAGR